LPRYHEYENPSEVEVRKVLGWLLFFIGVALFVRWWTLPFSREEAQELSSLSAGGPQAFINGINKLKKEAASPNDLNLANCASKIKSHTDTLYGLPSNYFMPQNAQQVELLKNQGLHTLRDMYELRLILRNRLKEFERAGPMDMGCVDAIRRAFRVTRFSEEFLIEWLQFAGIVDKGTYTILKGPFPHMSYNSEFGEKDREFRAGDVILIYGQAVVSGMISQIGDEEGSFSHQAIIGQDEQGHLYAVEGLIQFGTRITPLEDWLKEGGDSRAVHMRFEDPLIAQKAGQLIYQKAQTYILKNHHNIPYDFAMDDKNHDTLFCAEVIQTAFELATEGNGQTPMQYPRYRTQTHKLQGTGFLEAMGIKTTAFAAPSDIEVDTRFNVIGEYRNVPKLRHMRIQEAIIRSVYDWMAEKDYRFRFDLNFRGKSFIVKSLRYLGLFKEKLPTYMPVPSLEIVLKMTSIADSLNAAAGPWEEAYFKANGHSYTFQELMLKMEELRKKDCKVESEKRTDLSFNGTPDPTTSEFHWFFKSSKGCYE
jgi:hypothetical protein